MRGISSQLFGHYSSRSFRSFPVGVYHPTTLAFRHRKESIVVYALPCGSSSRLTFSTTARIFASPPPTLSTSTSKTSTPTPPLPKPPGKPKVDLRPGPIKAPTSTLKSQSTEAPASSSAPTSSLQASNTVESEKKVDAKEGGKKAEPGIIEATKEDYDKAIEHGILAPPPANAGRVGKLYHQAKEIFVSLSFLSYEHFSGNLSAPSETIHIRIVCLLS